MLGNHTLTRLSKVSQFLAGRADQHVVHEEGMVGAAANDADLGWPTQHKNEQVRSDACTRTQTNDSEEMAMNINHTP